MGGTVLPMLMGGGGMQQPIGFGAGVQMPQNLMGAQAGKPASMMSLGTPQSSPMRNMQMPQSLGGGGLPSLGGVTTPSGGGAPPTSPPLPPSRPSDLSTQTKAPMGMGPQTQAQGGYGSLTDLINAEARRAGVDPRMMQKIRWGESGHGSNYDINRGTPGKPEESYGPFQLNRHGGLGVQFEAQTGKDLSDPATIPEQTRFVANYLAKTGDTSPWAGWKTHPGYPSEKQIASWGDAGYRPTGKSGPTTQAPMEMGPQAPQAPQAPSPEDPQKILTAMRENLKKQSQGQKGMAQPQGGGGGDGGGKGGGPSAGGKGQSPSEMAGNLFAKSAEQRKQTGGWHAAYGNPKATILDLIKSA